MDKIENLVNEARIVFRALVPKEAVMVDTSGYYIFKSNGLVYINLESDIFG